MFWSREGSEDANSALPLKGKQRDPLRDEFPPKYSVKPCPHRGSAPTPILDAHLRQASTKSRLIELRDTIDSLIEADNDICIKCATSQVAMTLFSYLKDIREAKLSGEGLSEDSYKARKKAWKKEIKFIAKDMKKELKPVIRGG